MLAIKCVRVNIPETAFLCELELIDFSRGLRTREDFRFIVTSMSTAFNSFIHSYPYRM